MEIDYDRAKRNGRKLKAALTRAKNSGNPEQVAKACEQALAEWREWGCWPDAWATWAVAAEDAQRAHERAAQVRFYGDHWEADEGDALLRHDHAVSDRLAAVVAELRRY